MGGMISSLCGFWQRQSTASAAAAYLAMAVEHHEEADSQAPKVFVDDEVVLIFPPRIVGLQTLPSVP